MSAQEQYEPISKAAALRSVLEDAYEEASAGLGFAPVRMVGYAARRLVEVRYGIPADSITITHNGDFGYVLRSLEKVNPELADALNITKKPRGTGYEPHSGYEVKFGTLEVADYRSTWDDPWFGIVRPKAYQGVSTWGPEGLYQGVLVVEKDGLLEFVRRAGIGERYDLFVAASEGQGVEALRELIASFTEKELPIYLLHDYDIQGLQIAAALSGRDTKSWTWEAKPTVIDLGIHFDDIETWSIADESVSGEDDFVPLLEELGSSQEEIGYLVSEQWRGRSSRKNRDGKEATFWKGRRAELNGLIGQTFIDFIEAKLGDLPKLIPDDEALHKAYVHAVRVNRINEQIEELFDSMEDEEVDVPDDLRGLVELELERDRTLPWDLAVARLT